MSLVTAQYLHNAGLSAANETGTAHTKYVFTFSLFHVDDDWRVGSTDGIVSGCYHKTSGFICFKLAPEHTTNGW